MRLWSFAPMLLLSACVSQGIHEELKKKYDDAQAQLGKRETQVESLEQAIAAADAKAKELETAIAAAQERIAVLEQQRSDKEAEIARLEKEGRRLEEDLAALIKDRSRLKASAAELKDALAELSRRKAEADRRVAEFRGLLAKFKSLIDAGKLKVKIVDGRMVLALPTDVLFDSGSAKLSKEGTTAVSEVATILKGMPTHRFQVEGHTDNVPIHTERYPSNWELSSARALGVGKAMLVAGMDPRSLSVAGFGEHRPATTNDTDANKAQNRRIEIVVVPDLSMLPGFNELNRIVSEQ